MVSEKFALTQDEDSNSKKVTKKGMKEITTLNFSGEFNGLDVIFKIKGNPAVIKSFFDTWPMGCSSPFMVTFEPDLGKTTTQQAITAAAEVKSEAEKDISAINAVKDLDV